MMKRAERVHGLRSLAAVLMLGLLTWGGIEGYGHLKASALVESLTTAGTTDVAAITKQIAAYRRWADSRLKQVLIDYQPDSRNHLHASLALLPVDPRPGRLSERKAPHGVTQRCLGAARGIAASSSVRDAQALGGAWKPPSLMILACSHPPALSLFLMPGMIAGNRRAWPCRMPWSGSMPCPLAPGPNCYSRFAVTLAPRLAAIFKDKQRSESERSLATNVLSDYASDDPNLLADLLMVADDKPYSILFPIAQREATRIVPVVSGRDRQEGGLPVERHAARCIVGQARFDIEEPDRIGPGSAGGPVRFLSDDANG